MFNRFASIFLIAVGVGIILFFILITIVPLFGIFSIRVPLFPNVLFIFAFSVMGVFLGSRLLRLGWSLWQYLNMNPKMSGLKEKDFSQLTSDELKAIKAKGLVKLILFLITFVGICYGLWTLLQ